MYDGCKVIDIISEYDFKEILENEHIDALVS